MEKEIVLNIDDKNIFINPFQNTNPSENAVKLYEQFLSCKPNQKILKKIGNNEIFSRENEKTGITRSEILRRMACKFGYRTKLTVVQRDILSNTYGIILNQVNCIGDVIGDEFSKKICSKYPIVEEVYNKYLIKTPGAIQLIHVSKIPTLWVCNIFTQKDVKHPTNWIFNIFGKATKVDSKNDTQIKNALTKLSTQIKKNKLQNLPIYVPNEMGKYQGWDWNQTTTILMKIFPDIVVCKN